MEKVGSLHPMHACMMGFTHEYFLKCAERFGAGDDGFAMIILLIYFRNWNSFHGN